MFNFKSRTNSVFIDLKHFIIPNLITFPMMALGFIKSFDPNLNQSMSMAFSGEASQLDVNSRNAVIGAIIYSVPTVEELYPEEDNEEILAKYKNIRDAVIYEELQKYGLVTKKERVQQLTDIELMDLGVNYPGDKEVQAQIEALNLQ